MNILVICTGNSCRSQMAHGYFKQILGENHRVFSAGYEAHGVNPRTVKVMAEDGISIDNHTSNTMSDYLDTSFDFVITMSEKAKENCLAFSGHPVYQHQLFTDPFEAKGSEEEILKVYRQVQQEIKQFCINWKAKHLT